MQFAKNTAKLVGGACSDDDDNFQQMKEDQEEPKYFEGGEENEEEKGEEEKKYEKEMEKYDDLNIEYDTEWRKTNKVTDKEIELFKEFFFVTDFNPKTEEEDQFTLNKEQRDLGLEYIRLWMQVPEEKRDNLAFNRCECGAKFRFKRMTANINFDLPAIRCARLLCNHSRYKEGEFYIECIDDDNIHEGSAAKYHMPCFLQTFEREMEVRQSKSNFLKDTKCPPNQEEEAEFEKVIEKLSNTPQNVIDLIDKNKNHWAKNLYCTVKCPNGDLLDRKITAAIIEETKIDGFYNCRICGLSDPCIEGGLYGCSCLWQAHKKCYELSHFAKAMKANLFSTEELADKGTEYVMKFKKELDKIPHDHSKHDKSGDKPAGYREIKAELNVDCHFCTGEEPVTMHTIEEASSEPFKCNGCNVNYTYLNVLQCSKEEEPHLVCLDCLGIDLFERQMEHLKGPDDRTEIYKAFEDTIKIDNLDSITGNIMFRDECLENNPKTLAEFYPAPLKCQIEKLKVDEHSDQDEEHKEEEEEEEEENPLEICYHEKDWVQLFEIEASNVSFLSDNSKLGIIRKNFFHQNEFTEDLLKVNKEARNKNCELPGEFKSVAHECQQDKGGFLFDVKRSGLKLPQQLIICDASFQKREHWTFTEEIEITFDCDSYFKPSIKIMPSAASARTWLLPSGDLCFDSTSKIYKQKYSVVFLVGGIFEIIELEAKWADNDDDSFSIHQSNKKMIFRKKNRLLHNQISSVKSWIDSETLSIKGIKIELRYPDVRKVPVEVEVAINGNEEEKDEDEEKKEQKFTDKKINVSMILEIGNSAPSDFEIKNDLTYSRYYKFINPKDKNDGFLVAEMKLTDDVINSDKLNLVDRCLIMNSAMRTLLNMVPHTKNIAPEVMYNQYNWLQPLESLKGHSLCQILIMNKDLPKHLGSSRLEKRVQPTILAEYLEANKVWLEKFNFLESPCTVSLDLNLEGPISFALTYFNPNIVKDPVDQVLEYILSEPTNLTHQIIMQGLLPQFLGMAEPPAAFCKFFQDDGTDTKLSFATLLTMPGLPQSSDDACVFQIQEDSHEYELLEANHNTANFIMEHEMLDDYSELPIKHYCFDFRFGCLQHKLATIRFEVYEKEEKKQTPPTDEVFEKGVLDMAGLCIIISRIIELYGKDIESQKQMRDMIDGIFERTQRFIFIQGAVFFFGLVVPFLIQMFLCEKYQALITILCQVCLVTELMFFSIELMQMKKDSFIGYLKDGWNWIDLSLFMTFVTYYIKRLFLDHRQAVIPATAEDPGKWSFSDVADRTPEDVLPWVILNSFMIVLLTIKMLFFLRVSQSYGQLVKLISQTLVDIKVFLVFYMLWTAIFALLFKIAGFTFNFGDYISMHEGLQFFLTIFRNSIGDIKRPHYGFWTNPETIKGDYSGVISGGMAGYAWLLFFLQITFMLIILLNFLIAIISQSYEAVMSSATVSEYADKADFNIEIVEIYTSFVNTFSQVDQGSMFFLASAANTGTQTTIYDGLIKTVSNNTNTQMTALYDKLSSKIDQDKKETNKQFEKLFGEFKKLKKAIKPKTTNLNNTMDESIFIEEN